MTASPAPRRHRELTGRAVLFCLLAFFGVVIAVNAVLVRAATSTFGGLETDSSYKAGLAFMHEVAAARAQQAREWKIDAHLVPAVRTGTQTETRVEITARDSRGTPLAGLDLALLLEHPTDKRLDHAVVAKEIRAGTFRAVTDALRGQWEMVIELSRGGERLFRSKNRITLR